MNNQQNLKVGNGFRIEGFIDIDIINKKNHIKKHYHNTITKGGKQLILDKSCANMLRIGADMFGAMYMVNPFTTLYDGGKYSSYTNCMTNVLANLGDKASELNVDSSFLPIWNSDLTEADKVVGYANNCLNPVNNGKEGILDSSRGEYVLDGQTNALRWKYPEGVATGTFNVIAMMSKSAINDPTGGGIQLLKCIDKINTQYANYVNMSTGFLPPGISGFTANDEILLNFKKDDCERWKFSLTTGEVTQVPDSDPFFVITRIYYGNCTFQDYYVENNYLYLIANRSTDDRFCYVRVYDISNDMKYITEFSLSTNAVSYCKYSKFLKYNGELYISMYNTDDTSYQTSRESPYNLVKLSKGSNAYYSNCSVSNYASAGITLPSGLNIYSTLITNYGDDYIVNGIICSDLNNVVETQKGFMKEWIRGITFSAGSNKGVILIGSGGLYNSDSISFSKNNDYTDYRRIITTNDKTETKIYTTATGIWISLDDWWTNLISFVVLPEPITKGEDDVMYVSYGYKIV